MCECDKVLLDKSLFFHKIISYLSVKFIYRQSEVLILQGMMKFMCVYKYKVGVASACVKKSVNERGFPLQWFPMF